MRMIRNGKKAWLPCSKAWRAQPDACVNCWSPCLHMTCLARFMSSTSRKNPKCRRAARRNGCELTNGRPCGGGAALPRQPDRGGVLTQADRKLLRNAKRSGILDTVPDADQQPDALRTLKAGRPAGWSFSVWPIRRAGGAAPRAITYAELSPAVRSACRDAPIARVVNRSFRYAGLTIHCACGGDRQA
jgi:hypothetical protein